MTRKGGRPPKPKEIAEMDGRGVALERDSMRVDSLDVCPPPPAEIPLGEAGLRVWHDVASTLTQVGVIGIIDLEALAIYCNAFQLYTEAAEKVRDEGMIIEEKRISQTGDEYIVTKKNPYLTIMNEQFAVIRDGWSRFGLTPSDRVSIPGKASPVQDLKNKWNL